MEATKASTPMGTQNENGASRPRTARMGGKRSGQRGRPG